MTELGVRIEVLVEERTTPRLPLPPELETAYGGALRLPDEVVYANFVASIDGVAAIAGVPMSSSVISGGAAPDRFVMSLLRLAADAVVVGVGTLREHGGPWTAERAFPPGEEVFARARADLAMTAAPMLVVVTASGRVPPDNPVLADAIVATTTRGARNLADADAASSEVLDLGDAGTLDAAALVRALRDRGYGRILTEGGPRLMGSMLDPPVVDQLFLTVAPRLVGGGPGRMPLSAERDLLGADLSTHLLEARASADYLFLRYGVAAKGASNEAMTWSAPESRSSSIE